MQGEQQQAQSPPPHTLNSVIVRDTSIFNLTNSTTHQTVMPSSNQQAIRFLQRNNDVKRFDEQEPSYRDHHRRQDQESSKQTIVSYISEQDYTNNYQPVNYPLDFHEQQTYNDERISLAMQSQLPQNLRPSIIRNQQMLYGKNEHSTLSDMNTITSNDVKPNFSIGNDRIARKPSQIKVNGINVDNRMSLQAEEMRRDTELQREQQLLEQKQNIKENFHRSNVLLKSMKIDKKGEDPDEEEVIDYDEQKQSPKKFQESYIQLTEKLINDLYSGKEGNIKLLLISDKDLQKFNERMESKSARLRNGSKNVFENLYTEAVKSKHRREQEVKHREEQSTNEEIKDCTFHPTIQPNKRHSRNRSPEQFYSEMMSYQQNVTEKVNNMRNQINTNDPPKLKRRHTTNRLITVDKESLNESVYDRLYSKANKSKQNALDNSQFQFSPRINERSRKLSMNKSNSRIESLYVDAMRRSFELKDKQTLRKKEMEEKKYISPSKTNKHSNQLVREKLGKELSEQFSILHLMQERELLNYHQFQIIFQAFLYVQPQNQLSDIESQLLLEAWNSLKQRVQVNQIISKEGVSYQNLLSFLFAINKVYPSQNIGGKCLVRVEENLQRPFGNMSTDGKYYFENEEQVNSVAKAFISFKDCRNLLMSERNVSKKQEREKSMTANFFKPKLNKNSVNLAKSQLDGIKKEFERNNMQIDHTEIILKKGLLYQQRSKTRRDEAMRKSQEDCTFKPKTLNRVPLNRSKLNQSSENLNQSARDQGPQSVYDALFQLSKSKKQSKRDVNTHELEYERGKKDCTFKPNLQMSQKDRVLKKNSDSQIFRHSGQAHNSSKNLKINELIQQSKLSKYLDPAPVAQVNLENTPRGGQNKI